ncbi:MAG TPA: hypothetical protein DEB30_04065 [Candidatus Peribacter riflensis]|uniref:Uncharacterized protein n=1 Tax=Candidatus Peribacter riflensis TaxID=1735162 RepID=A0A0S1SNV9_9BACT|nr:MAG: hypothetical protein PeribacterA2_0758 [Candidatus Peribacter riflensis]OGJ77810.1 MAG: hypothetical protein A2398_00875 [Candidatus Peribacteria bacterium RIFOXYB1_FULL_57_12]OGJ80351.1 MAG: hypothetical protein A2412_01620 [Candidatus Peribacteria bacterium RIFOXYC1_FULL_58_8]ALM11226.1 MAG: hypothetical protein PeribacterB2_0760 [Candidatus Peribacter riflensis]ALM12329.1 MAG: hypothetical protein PeribacterC2_0760 [Candidatus Peribacter riflensis]
MAYRFFRQAHTASELDSGEGMEVHPVSGTLMRYLYYDVRFRRFYALIPEGAWDPNPEQVWEKRISEDRDVRPGEPLPSHWRFNPYPCKKRGKRRV